MKKVIQILKGAHGVVFGINGRNVTVNEAMSIADAEHIAGIYPGLYVVVSEVEKSTVKPATKETTKTGIIAK